MNENLYKVKKGKEIKFNSDQSAARILKIKGETYQETEEAQTGLTITGKEIEITNVDSTKENDIILKGDMKQKTYTGKNKLPNNLTTQTINGVTAIKNLDGSVTLSGTATANTDFYMVGSATNYVDLGLEVGQYILNGCTSDGSNSTYALFCVKESGLILLDTGSGKALEVAEGDKFRIFIRVLSGVTISNKVFYPMLKLSSITDDSYEPHVGSTASPNPDYPQDIEVVKPYNLFNYVDNIVASSYGITNILNEDGSITTSGVPTSNYVSVTSYVDITDILEDGVKYTLYKENSSVYVLFEVTAAIDGTNKQWYSSSFTVDKTTYDQYRIRVITGTTANWGTETRTITNKYMLIKGTEEKPYAPYGCISVKMQNKNLFDDTNFKNKTISEITSSNYRSESTPIKVKANRNYISTIKCTDGTIIQNDWNLAISFRDSSNDQVVNFKSGITFTFTEEQAKQITQVLFITNSTGITTYGNKIINCIQIEQGSTATDCVQHQEQNYLLKLGDIELCGNDTARDYFHKLNNKWYKKSNWEKFVLDGTENWVYNSNIKVFYVDIIKNGTAIANKGVSTHFLNGNYTNTNNVFNISTANRLHIRADKFTTLNDFKTWLSTKNSNGTPVTVYYLLATPTDTEITDTTLIEQLELLKKIQLYEEYTYITSQAETEAILELNYNYISAKPNPDYPREIKVVEPYNLFNLEKYFESVNINNCTKELLDTGIKLNFTAGVDAFVGMIMNSGTLSEVQKNTCIEVETGENYTLSTKENMPKCYIGLYDENYNGKGFYTIPANSTSYTFSIPEDVKYIVPRFGIQNTNYTTYSFTNILLIKGTEVKPYTPYGCIGVKTQNKNLFDYNKFINAGHNSTLNDGIFENVSASTSMLIGVNASSSPVNYVELKSGKVYVKAKIKSDTSTTTSATYLCCKFKNGTSKNYQFALNKSLTTEYQDISLEYTVLNDCVSYGLVIYHSTSAKISVKDVMISYNETPYIEHQEQNTYIKLPEGEYLAKINESENFIDSNGILNHNISKLVLDGTENWFISNTYFAISGKNYKKYSDGGNCISTHYEAAKAELVSTKDYCIWIGNSNFIQIKDISYTTLEDFKSYLAEQYEAGTPVEVYYMLETPTTVELESSEKSKLLNTPVLLGENIMSIEPLNPEFILRYHTSEEDEEEPQPITITNNGKLLPFGLTIDYKQTDLPLMAEASETTQILSGIDGEIVLDTRYTSRIFDIVAFTEDYLLPEEKEEKREEIRQFLNSIKNKTTKLIIEPLNRTFEVKYNSLAEDTNLPQCVQFNLPLKSSSPYAISNEKYTQIEEGSFESNTVAPVGFICTIEGPASFPTFSLNDYMMNFESLVPEGTKLIIDTKKSTVTFINKVGMKTNGMPYYNHQFPKIEKGNNYLSLIDGLENANIKIEWNDLLL